MVAHVAAVDRRARGGWPGAGPLGGRERGQNDLHRAARPAEGRRGSRRATPRAKPRGDKMVARNSRTTRSSRRTAKRDLSGRGIAYSHDGLHARRPLRLRRPHELFAAPALFEEQVFHWRPSSPPGSPQGCECRVGAILHRHLRPSSLPRAPAPSRRRDTDAIDGRTRRSRRFGTPTRVVGRADLRSSRAHHRGERRAASPTAVVGHRNARGRRRRGDRHRPRPTSGVLHRSSHHQGGRSTTSPAAIWLATSGGSRAMRSHGARDAITTA